MIYTNHIGDTETASYPSHRIEEARSRWREVYAGCRRDCCAKLGAWRNARLARGNRGPPSKKSCETDLQCQSFHRSNTMTTITPCRKALEAPSHACWHALPGSGPAPEQLAATRRSMRNDIWVVPCGDGGAVTTVEAASKRKLSGSCYA